MRLIKNCGDRGNKLKEDLCEEAPPERPYLRREDRDHKGPKSPGDLPSNEKTANAKINQDTLLPALNMPAVEESLVTNTLKQAEDND